MQELERKFNVLKGKLSLYFFVSSVILAVTIFLVLSDSFKEYRSTITILFVPKSEIIAQNTDEVLENLQLFPRYLSFYDLVLQSNKALKDPYASYSKDERKNLWNSNLHIKKIKGSTLLEISVENSDKNQASEFARQTALTLFNRASFYYNIKNEVDFRMVDGPTSSASIGKWYFLAPLSVLLGIILSFLLNYIVWSLTEIIKPKKQLFTFKLAPLANKKIEFPSAEYYAEAEEAPYEIPRTQTKPSAAKSHQAPLNLPIGEDELYEFPSEPQIANGPQNIAEIKEPTEEEYKKRLNQLLKGEL